jgi:PAS domain S-box-containing protein
MGVSLDITEQKQAEAMLRENEARLASAIEVAALGFYELAENNRATFLDGRVRALLGIPQGQDHLTFDYWKERLHPDDRQRMLGIVRDIATASMDKTAAEYRYQHPQHGLLWFNHAVHVLERDAAGVAVRRIGVIQDITERKRTEEALRASEEVSRATFEQAAVGMAHVGTDGRWLRVNDKLCAIVGYPRDELLKLTFQDITHPEDLEADLNYVRQVLSGRIKTYTMEKRYIRKDGSLIWIYLTVSLVRDAAGAPRHFISVVEDITERKNAEEELKQLRLHLWHADRVAQTAAVTASLAHELNQPLAAILTNAQVGLQFMAGGNPDLEEIREILTDIVEDDKRAGAVVRGLRDLLRRKETGRGKIKLADTIRWILDMLNSELLDKQVQLHLELEPDSLVLADKAQVQQVILNLVMNAVEAMQGQPAGQRRLELTMTHTDAGEALVAVRDSGPGILDRPEKVFEAFWTTKQEGLGLGLMISRSIIESHNGRLWFANNPDQGVTFYFTLPFIIDLDPAGPESGPPDP